MKYGIPLFMAILIGTVTACHSQINPESISLPEGFEIEVYLSNITKAREMAYSPSGVLYIGSWSGEVYAVEDTDHDWNADSIHVLTEGWKWPVGVDYYDGDLYFSALDQILKIEDVETDLENPAEPIVIYDDLPDDNRHGWKFIRVGPDGMLYVPVGAPCNICLSEDEIYASLARMTTDGEDFEIYAHGIRNTVGFDWHPLTGELWFTENGRDWLGDNQPPDELNTASEPGLHFGYPFVHGEGIEDTDYWEERPEGFEYVKPVQELGPHVAALGMRFYTGEQFPEEYRNQIFIAEHGSWNRSEKIGYRVTLIRFDENRAVSYETFASGWLENGEAWGRPADVEVAPDGSLLVSDDHAGAVYRIFYTGE